MRVKRNRETDGKFLVPTLISQINVALRLFFLGGYSRPYAVIKKPLGLFKNWVKIEKSGYFQKLLYIALHKCQALR